MKIYDVSDMHVDLHPTEAELNIAVLADANMTIIADDYHNLRHPRKHALTTLPVEIID